MKGIEGKIHTNIRMDLENVLKLKEPDTKTHTVDSRYMKCPEQRNSLRPKDLWLSGTRERREL